MGNNFDIWFNQFEEGWKVRVVENEHLLNICFLQFISTINKVRYIYGGQYKTVNISGFKIQQSGTGKGVGDGYVHDLLRHLNYNVCKLNSFTEAGVIGTLNTNHKGHTEVYKGALGEYDFIWVDEARNLIVGNQWSQGLLEVINGYLDDGRIFKRLAKGEIKYWSNCNFGTGTFFFGKLKPTVLTTGLFQRALFSYKTYTKQDIIRISKKYDELAFKNYITDLLPVFKTFEELKNNLNFDKYNVSKTEHKNYIIKMDIEASRKFGELVDNYFNKEIFNQVSDNRLKDILTSFLIRYKELGHKIMCLYSVWNQYDSINLDSVDYAFNVIKQQLNYVLEFISEVFEGKSFDNEDLGREDIKQKKIITTKQTIVTIIKNNPGMIKTEFRNYIQKNKRGIKVGELQIIGKLLPQLIDDNIIREETEEHNRTHLYLN